VKSTSWLVVLGLLGPACFRPSEQRAERDAEVGQAKSDRLEIAVSDGLAAVREMASDRLLLWASAPRWQFVLRVPRALTLTLEIRNAMADGRLELERGSGLVEELATERPTQKRYRLELPEGELRFTFGPPDFADRRPFRFALLSDVQEAIDRVGDIFRTINAQDGVRFLLGAGDLTRQGTHEELRRYQRELEGLDVPYYTTLGNHELGQDPSLYQDYFGRGSFQFAYRGVVFTLLDSASATLDPMVYEWLQTWLELGRDGVHVVAMHIPPLDPIGVRNGAFASRAEAAKLLGLLAEGRVDLTLYGHIHSYYSFENAGIPAYISGGGGAIPERFDEVGRHFLLLEIEADAGVRDTRLVRVFPEGP
jgi:Icc protein